MEGRGVIYYFKIKLKIKLNIILIFFNLLVPVYFPLSICTQLNGSKYNYLTVTIKHQSFVCIQLILFDSSIGPYQVLPLQVRVDQGVMTIKVYSTLLRSPNLELHHPIQFSVIPRSSPFFFFNFSFFFFFSFLKWSYPSACDTVCVS